MTCFFSDHDKGQSATQKVCKCFKEAGATLQNGAILRLPAMHICRNFKKMSQKNKLIPILILSFFLSSCTKELVMNDEGNLVPKTVKSDPSLPAITVNGSKFHAETFGNPA